MTNNIIHTTIAENNFYTIRKRAGYFGLKEADEILLDFLLNKDKLEVNDSYLLNLSQNTGYKIEDIDQLTFENFIPKIYVFQVVQLPIKTIDSEKNEDIIERPILLYYNTFTQQYHWTASFDHHNSNSKISLYEEGEIDFEIKIDMSGFEITHNDLTKEKLFQIFGKNDETKEIKKTTDNYHIFNRGKRSREDFIRSPQKIYQDIYQELKQTIILENSDFYHFITCLIISSYFVELIRFFLVFHITGEKGSGKSTLGEIIAKGSRYGYFVSSTTKADLEARYDHLVPTGVFDEQEIEENRRTIESILNSGSTHGASIGKRKKVGGKWVAGECSVYGFKVLLGINKGLLSEVTESRSIPLTMKKRTRADGGKKAGFQIDEFFWKNIRDDMFITRMQKYVDFWKNYKKIAHVWDSSGSERLESMFYCLFTIVELFGDDDESSKFYTEKISGSLFNILSLTERHQTRLKYDPIDDALKGILFSQSSQWVDQYIPTSTIGQLVFARLSEWERQDIRIKTNYKAANVLGREINQRLEKWGFTERGRDREQGFTRLLDRKSYNSLLGVELPYYDDGKNKITDFVEIKPEELQKRIDSIKTPSSLMKFFTELAKDNGGVLDMGAFYKGLEKTEGLNDEDLDDVKKYAGELVHDLEERGLVVATGKEGEFILKV